MKTVISDKIVNARFGQFGQGTEERPANAQGGDETVEIVENADGTYSVKSPDGSEWLSIQEDGTWGARQTSDPSQPGPWEKFTKQGNCLTELPKAGVARALVEVIVRDLSGTGGGGSTPPSQDVTRLVGIDRSTHRFVDDQGRKVKLKGADAFLLFKRFLDGEDIDPFLDQHRDLGYNLLRVMGMFESLGGFNPKAYPNYYSQIAAFLERCRVKGFWVLWTACAATGKWMTEDEAIEHIKQTVAEGKQAINFLFSPVNEQGQHNNSINLAKYLSQVDLTGVLHDNGSYGMDEPCPAPLGHWAPLHIRRVWSAVVKDNCVVDHPNYGDVEVALDEPDRYGDEGNQNVRRCADAAGTAYTALFWVFHSMQGERAEVLHGNTLECAQAAIAAMAGQ